MQRLSRASRTLGQLEPFLGFLHGLLEAGDALLVSVGEDGTRPAAGIAHARDFILARIVLGILQGLACGVQALARRLHAVALASPVHAALLAFRSRRGAAAGLVLRQRGAVRVRI